MGRRDGAGLVPPFALSARVRARDQCIRRRAAPRSLAGRGCDLCRGRFDPNVRSSAGAVGLMQVLPETGEFIARSTGGTDFVEADLRDPDINVRYGTWLLDYLRTRYDGDVETALAAYHAGPANVDEWRRTGAGIEFPETRAYVDEVLRVKQVYAQAYGRDLGL